MGGGIAQPGALQAAHNPLSGAWGSVSDFLHACGFSKQEREKKNPSSQTGPAALGRIQAI
jgi:hypothetical protein